MRKLESIPYMGSKRAIAHDIVKYIRMKNPNAKVFIDLFGGGGAVSVQALYQGFEKVVYNELNPRVFNLMDFICKRQGIPREWYKHISREEFKEIITSDDKSAFSGMVECCWSFGNTGKAYLYGKDIEEQKKFCEDIIVNQSEKSSKELFEKFNINIKPTNEKTINERYLKGFKPQVKNRLDLQRLEQMERLQRLERLERLEQLERLNMSYEEVFNQIDLSKYNPDEIVIYCDPPYRETAEYVEGGFNHKEFDDWFLKLPFNAYLSEYNSPFEKVYSVMKKSLLSAVGNSKDKEEKLFINKLSSGVEKKKKEIKEDIQVSIFDILEG